MEFCFAQSLLATCPLEGLRVWGQAGVYFWIKLHVAGKVMLWGRAITTTIMTSYTVIYLFQLKVTRIHADQTAGSFTDSLHILRGDAAASRNMFNHILVRRKPPSVSQGCIFFKHWKTYMIKMWSNMQQQWQSCTCFPLSPKKRLHLHQQVRKIPESNIITFTFRFEQPIIILYI